MDRIVTGPIVFDGVLDEDTRLTLLKQLPRLLPGMRQFRPTIDVPEELEYRIKDIVKWCADGTDPSSMSFRPISAHASATTVEMPAKVSVGSSRAMHQDARFDANGYIGVDQTTVKGYVAVLYLDGGGNLVFDSGMGEREIALRPGRLVVWLNEACMHRVEASPDGEARSLLGPMYISEEGFLQAVGHMGTLMEQYPPKRPAPAPRPKTNVAITVSLDDAATPTWVCTNLSGDEVVRVLDHDKVPTGILLQRIKRSVAEALPESEEDVHVVLLDSSGATFKLPERSFTPSDSSAPSGITKVLSGVGPPQADTSSPTPSFDEGYKAPELEKVEEVHFEKGSDGFWTLESLQAGCPEGVNPAEKEQALRDDIFKEVFGKTKAEFAAFPKWKQQQAKKDHNLF